MGRSIVISERLYEKLEAAARQRGLASVEQLLEEWQAREADFDQRREAVRRIDALRERLREAYGEMPDSVPLIREDREC
jgi:5'-deoxynucleotidase YfbR-like HD superfamily hydrolase